MAPLAFRREFDPQGPGKRYRALEAQVPEYTLPDPLVHANGGEVTSREQWASTRRPEIIELFEKHVYGKTPREKTDILPEVLEASDAAFGGLATRKQVSLALTPSGRDGPRAHLLLYTPNEAAKKGPVPAFLLLNFLGNHTTTTDKDVIIQEKWYPPQMLKKLAGAPLDKTRGMRASRFPVASLLHEGFAIGTMYCGDMMLDSDQFGLEQSILPHFKYHGGNCVRHDDEWGAIGAWAWGLSRGLDYIIGHEKDTILPAKVVVGGHSRLGKAALWAGAQDERFGGVVSNDSGCGGAALSRRRFGETVVKINTRFPHWFCDNFKTYNENEAALPVEQHMLLAAVAPRLLHVGSASMDLWADPRGEFLAAVEASKVYEFLGLPGIESTVPPPRNGAYNSGLVGYHLRGGRHDLTSFDWHQYVAHVKRLTTK